MRPLQLLLRLEEHQGQMRLKLALYCTLMWFARIFTSSSRLPSPAMSDHLLRFYDNDTTTAAAAAIWHSDMH